MYAQKLEGDTWIGEKMDTAKLEKMSGLWPDACFRIERLRLWLTRANRPTIRPIIRTYAGYTETKCGKRRGSLTEATD